MVAYSFKKEFGPLIAAGFKTQTIRGYRKRHARPGERLQLFTGMRTKHCKKVIPDPICTSVTHIEIEVGPARIEHIRFYQRGLSDTDRGRCKGSIAGGRPMDRFAVEDGFEDLEAMHRFWLKEHGPGTFRGVMVQWGGAE